MNRWPCIAAGVSLVAGACIKVPEFKGGDGGTGDASADGPTCAPDYSVNNANTIAFTPANDGGLVTAPGYTMHFATGSQFHFPDDITVGGIDVMDARGTNCPGEDLAGMSLFPAPAIRANGTPTPGANDLISPDGWRGPAVVRLTTHWSTSYGCGATPGGDSMFTLFPDGRVMRHDFMYNNAQQDWATCSCGGTAFYPSSYWTFVHDRFSSYYLGGSTIAQDLSSFSGQAQNPGRACVEAGAAVSAAVGWRPQTANNAHRLIEIANGTGLAFVHDFYTMHTMTDVGPFEYSTSSVLVLGGGCAAAAPKTSELVMGTGQLYVNDEQFRPAAADGIYGGAEDRNGAGGIDVAAMTATLRGTTIAGFSVWLRFPQPTCDVTITKNPDPGNPFFVKQQIDNDEWVIWFRDSLTGTSTITISAQ